jgi:hypothetical protein
LDEQQKVAESSSTAEEQGALVQREQVVEVRVASSSNTRAGCYGAEGASHSSTEGASGSNLGAVAAQDVDHGGGSSNGSTSLAKRECYSL